jgi:RNA recognition motif-containing protein
MNIYVGNLPFNLGEEDLREIFEEYGEVASTKIISDKFSGRSKGFGFVEMENDGEANNAIKELNNAEISGRNIKVNESVPKPAESRGGERRGGGFGGERRGGYSGGGERRGGGGGFGGRRERY